MMTQSNRRQRTGIGRQRPSGLFLVLVMQIICWKTLWAWTVTEGARKTEETVEEEDGLHIQHPRYYEPPIEDNVDGEYTVVVGPSTTSPYPTITPTAAASAGTISPFPTETPQPTITLFTDVPATATTAPTVTQYPTVTPSPTERPAPSSSSSPTMTPAPSTSLYPTMTPAPSTSLYPTMTPAPSTTSSTLVPTSPSSQPTATSSPALICTLDDSGSFGVQQGSTTIVQFYFQLETAPGAGRDAVRQEILPIAETRITNLFLPDLFPYVCHGRRRLEHQLIRQIVGISSRPVDMILEGVVCPNELVDSTNNCFLIDGAFTLIYVENRRFLNGEATVEQLLAILEARMTAGELDDIDARVIKITYVSGTGLDVVDPVAGPDVGATDGGGDGGIPVYGWALIVAAAICVLLLLICYAITRRRRRAQQEEAEQQQMLMRFMNSPLTGKLEEEEEEETTPPDQVYVDSSDFDSEASVMGDDISQGDSQAAHSTPHDSEVYLSERSGELPPSTPPDTEIGLDSGEDGPEPPDGLSAFSFASAPTVQRSGGRRPDEMVS